MKHARITALTDDVAAISALSAETDSAKVSLEDLERSMGGAFSIQSGQTVSLPCPITQLHTNYRPITDQSPTNYHPLPNRTHTVAPSQVGTQGGVQSQRGEFRTVSAIAADIEDCEIAKSAAEKDRDLTRRRKERTDRDLLDAERALAATREEHLRAQAKADRLTELRRELVRIRCSIAQLTSPSHRQITNR